MPSIKDDAIHLNWDDGKISGATWHECMGLSMLCLAAVMTQSPERPGFPRWRQQSPASFQATVSCGSTFRTTPSISFPTGTPIGACFGRRALPMNGKSKGSSDAALPRRSTMPSSIAAPISAIGPAGFPRARPGATRHRNRSLQRELRSYGAQPGVERQSLRCPSSCRQRLALQLHF